MRRRMILLLVFVVPAAGCEPEIEMESRVRVRQAQPPADPTPPPPPTTVLPPADGPAGDGTGLRGGRCDPNYEPCVPVASDVDCAGGGSNGPAYAQGPVRVVGRDVYDLDRDGDGVACDG